MKECPACKLCFPDDVARCPNDGEQTSHTIAGEPVLDSRYQLIRRLGQGGMGVVYQARHSYLKTAHAIKVILPDLVGNDPNLVTRFRQEALAAAAIRHRNIVSVTDFGVVAGKMPFLVMEHVEGESLHDLLARERRFAPQLALEILSAICSGLSAAHRQDIVHRDLKPLNIMIARGAPIDEAVKILDFGLAKIRSGELLGSFVQAQTTGLMGSPYYMAPEQWSDDEPDARADVYSLGVILYQMLAGDVPFKGASIPSIMRKHLSDPPPPLTDFGLNLSPEIERVVHHALEKEPTKRTASVEKLTEEFRAALANSQKQIKVSPFASESAFKKETQTEVRPDSQTFAATGEPATTLRVLTNPPQSLVFLNGEKLGVSDADGWIVRDDIKHGTHKLRVVKDNHAAFEADIKCDGEVCQTVAELRNLAITDLPTQIKLEKPAETAPFLETFVSPQVTLKADKPAGKTNAQTVSDADLPIPLAPPEKTVPDAATQPFAIKSYPDVREPQTKSDTNGDPTKTQQQPKTATAQIGKLKSIGDSPKFRVDLPQTEVEAPPSSVIATPVIVAACLIGLLLVGGVGYAVYRSLFAPAAPATKIEAPPETESVNQNAGDKQQTAVSFKPEMASIPGGSFMMGFDKGQEQARPAHPVNVPDFKMSKYEITNEQYEQFVRETNHRAPGNWLNNRYLPEEAKLPVVAVNLADATAYAEWLSKKENVEYSLPTEAQWEYAARGGEAGNLYPWHNTWENGRAVLDSTAPQAVGSTPSGANKWGVQDLIGNVWEWTKTPFAPYPGSVKADNQKPGIAIRGGGFKDKPNKINSIFRNNFDPARRDVQIGFRVVIN